MTNSPPFKKIKVTRWICKKKGGGVQIKSGTLYWTYIMALYEFRLTTSLITDISWKYEITRNILLCPLEREFYSTFCRYNLTTFLLEARKPAMMFSLEGFHMEQNKLQQYSQTPGQWRLGHAVLSHVLLLILVLSCHSSTFGGAYMIIFSPQIRFTANICRRKRGWVIVTDPWPLHVCDIADGRSGWKDLRRGNRWEKSSYLFSAQRQTQDWGSQVASWLPWMGIKDRNSSIFSNCHTKFKWTVRISGGPSSPRSV